MAKKTLHAMCEERYADEEVRQHVLDHALELGHASKIERGELVLPSEEDANHWHARESGQEAKASADRGKDQRIAELENRIASMEAYMRSTKVPLAAVDPLTHQQQAKGGVA